jgi:transcriptional regulator with AAA-type ATPase domain
MFHLQFFKNGQPIFIHPLQKNTLIGRSDRCDVSLPSSEVSRKHCFVVKKGEEWWVEDLSKHGITVNGESKKKYQLTHGTKIGILDFSFVFVLGWESEQKTKEIPSTEEHMFILSADNNIHSYSSALIIYKTKDTTHRKVLSHPRIGLGGIGSDIVIEDPKLRENHCFLRTSRGRVMFEPGAGPVLLDGQILRQITPLYSEDELRIGDSTLQISYKVLEEAPYMASFGKMKSIIPEMHRLFGTLYRFACHHFHVLLLGESGTGKELAARAIHEHSPRRTQPFVAINCGSLPKELIESELFGYERGAFTGALTSKPGAFHQADGGTLFLDELGELTAEAQTKLLRVLESGEVRRVGAMKVEFPNVRIIAATNKDLLKMMDEGLFRKDLYYRITCLCGTLPPLRERLVDIPMLAKEILSEIAPKATLSEASCRVLQNHSWPGNIRELRNVLIRSFVLSGNVIDAADLQFQNLKPRNLQSNRIENEERHFIQLLEKHKGNRSAVARELGLSRSTFMYRLKRYGLE